ARPDQRSARLVVGQVDAVEQVCAIAGVAKERLRPPLCAEPGPDLSTPAQSQLMLRVSGGDAGGARWIDVDEEPPPPQDIGITRCHFRTGNEAVRGTRNQGRIDQ